MTEKQAIQIVSKLKNENLEFWIDGGWGIDSLVGKMTRNHNDIDLFFELSNKKCVLSLLSADSFEEVQKPYSTENHQVWVNDDGREVDIHFFEWTENGDMLFEGEIFSKEYMLGIGKIGSYHVKTFTAEAHMLFKQGYEHDADDVHDVKLLADNFGLPIPQQYQS